MPNLSSESCHHCGGTGRKNLRFPTISTNYCNKVYTGDCPPCLRLRNIQERIQGARQLLDQLLTEREELAETMNIQHDPFGQQVLPTEIISDIFLQCLPLESSLDIFATPDDEHTSVLNAILTLGQVCRRWRSISHSTPRLWNVLPITMSLQRRRELSDLQDWLGRSGGLPLFFQFWVGQEFPQEHYPELRLVIAQIIQQSHRLKGLNLRIPLTMIPWFFNDTPSLSAVHFEALCVQTFSNSDDMEFAVSLELETGPRLLRISNFRNPLRIQDWHTLIQAYMHELSGLEAIGILQNASNLQLCEFKGIYTPLPHPDTLTHSSLQELVIDDVALWVWDSISFPALRKLSILGVLVVDYDWSSFQWFLFKSSCPLTTLRLYDVDILEETLISILRLTPKLEDLRIGDMDVSDTFFNLLASQPMEEYPEINTSPSSTFLANLRRLDYNFPLEHSFTWESLVPLLKSKCSTIEENPPLLRSLTFAPSELDDSESQGTEDVIDDEVLWSIMNAARGIQLVIRKSGYGDIIEIARPNFIKRWQGRLYACRQLALRNERLNK